MVESAEDNFQDCVDDSETLQQNADAATPCEEVIQIVSTTDIEENIVFDDESSKQFSDLGVIVPVYSFADPRLQHEEQPPPPKYLSNQVVLQSLATLKQDILTGLIVNEEGCLVCTDHEALEKQKGVLVGVVRQLAINLVKGLSISHISLPIKIFEARSSIQRIVDLWSAAPKYLLMAAQTSDPVERMKSVIAFGLSSIILCTSQNKPFNPLLGETNQGTFADGTRYYCEHTSHHPPITHYLLEGPGNAYRMYGYYEIFGKMGKNSLTSGLRGPCTIEFPDGTRINFNAPDFRIGGTIMGDRTVEAISSIVFEDLAHQLRAVVVLGTFQSKGFFSKTTSGSKTDFQGTLYQIKPKFLNPTAFGKDQDLPSDLNKLKDVQTKLADISGNWLHNLSIGGQVYWDVDSHQVTRQIPQTEQDNLGMLLPSDWRYREDLIWLKYRFQTIAASWKLKLEVQQRKDRKNRQDVEKARSRKR